MERVIMEDSDWDPAFVERIAVSQTAPRPSEEVMRIYNAVMRKAIRRQRCIRGAR